MVELLELPEPRDPVIKFISYLTIFDPSVPLITTTRPTAINIMELGDQEFWDLLLLGKQIIIDTTLQLWSN